MVYCLNYHCPNPENPDKGKFCLHCGQKLWLSDRFGGLSLIQHGVKGRTILGIDRGTNPVSYCVIKQSLITGSVMPQDFLTEFNKNLTQLEKLGDRREFPKILHSVIPQHLKPSELLPMIVFEKITGESLLQQLNTHGCFKEEELVDFLQEILPLLQIIHDHGLVHRDLSPANLIFTPEKYWTIVDFTAAKVTSKVANAHPGTLIGSGIYTAPEQLHGKSYPASDLYSLGIICLELLTMMHPFELFSDHENRWVWRDFLTTPISDSLANLLDMLIEDRVGDRPASAQMALDHLQGKISLPIPIPVLTTPKPSPPPQKSNPASPKQTTPPTEEWHCFKTLKGHRGYISDLNFDETGHFLVSASADQTIRVWNTEYYWEVGCLRGHRGIVSAATFFGSQIISSSWDYTVRLWDWRTKTEGDRLEKRQAWITDLVLLENKHKLATLGADHHISLWDLKTKTFLDSWQADSSGLIDADGLSPVVASANHHDILLWQNQKAISNLSGHLDQITAFQISTNGKFLISAGADNTLRVWSVLNRKCDKIYQLNNPIQTIAIFPNKRFFAAGDDQGTLHIWQLGQEHPITSLSGHRSAIRAIAISPDNQTIATGSQDKTIKLWRFGIQ
ncbi:serine/threonine protein kinase with WD40 repeats [[Leptolyngbya] sp. PCC 7376]|uniref:WD40 repeat domain-containing serine/threonine-protein kinase n=1 Tax=[Leptolyngbya] sp. PCC 7376 TaxID=111781 RepID=UPI00029F38D9|nr:WD40 repeat domain-containing serine/threonine-protein kinase [[Leptolyngbya] sp. PCC 7376]AFY39413.1 serine/threonine protein kinase with WD40 repeats [[Leptolyngbya] sp. PCC 7376]